MSLILKKELNIFCQSIQKINFTQVRHGKSPAQTQRNYKKKQRIFGLKKNPGDRVDERMVIGTQKHIKYFPGLNVGINPIDKSLYAIHSGTIYYSIERVDLNPQNSMVRQYFLNKMNPYFNKYIHVVPDKLENEFRLVDIV